ncbi:MAG: AAC(3) family N-acetyltransferase, partial [Chloroflexota bacterium]
MDTKEGQLVSRTKQLMTTHSIVQDLKLLGVVPGMTLLVHSALSELGWVCGGPAAVILALLEALGPAGTLVMPTHSGDLSDPAKWKNPPVPDVWWEQIYANLPAYRADLTPTRAMGVIPETFRKMEGVLRSSHPQFSFSALGPEADGITSNHNLAHGMSEGSPLARIYDLAGSVLLLGVGHSNNTSLHLAENRADFPGKTLTLNGAPIEVDGERQWVKFEEIDYNDKDFSQIGS